MNSLRTLIAPLRALASAAKTPVVGNTNTTACFSRSLHTSIPVQARSGSAQYKQRKASDLRLGQLRDNPGARRKATRRGRGDRTAGRGVKGQGARKGKPRPGFEGGQTPLHMRIPKRGFIKPNKRKLAVVNLHKIQSWVDDGRIPLDRPLTMKVMQDSGLVTNIKDGVKLLGDGELTSPLKIEVTEASRQAIRSVRDAGGNVNLVYYNELGLRSLLKPHKFPVLPKLARPPRKLADRYLNSDPPTPREHPAEWPELFGLEAEDNERKLA